MTYTLSITLCKSFCKFLKSRYSGKKTQEPSYGKSKNTTTRSCNDRRQKRDYKSSAFRIRHPVSADIQEAQKDLLGGTIKKMMEAEMEEHLGYEKSERSDNDDYRNGYKSKTVKSSIGEVELAVPQDRKSTFAPQQARFEHNACR